MYTQSIRIYYNILHEVIYSIIDVINIIKKKIIEFYLRVRSSPHDDPYGLVRHTLAVVFFVARGCPCRRRRLRGRIPRQRTREEKQAEKYKGERAEGLEKGKRRSPHGRLAADAHAAGLPRFSPVCSPLHPARRLPRRWPGPRARTLSRR